MSKFLYLAAVLMLSCLVHSEIAPAKITIEPLVITTNIQLRPPPVLINPAITQDSPCGFRSYCGQAMNFRTEAELKTFTDKNCPPLLYMYKAADGSVAQPTQGTTSQAPTNDHSTTNNQQVNVDQADIIKTDGSYIYSVSGNVLSVIKAYPYNTTKVMSTLSFTATPASLFIEGNYLAVFGTDYEQTTGGFNPYPMPIQGDMMVKRPYFMPTKPYTWVYIYDLTKKEAPKLIKDYKFQGYYYEGRKASTGYVYLLSQINCNNRDSLLPWYNFGQGKKNMTLQQVFYYPKSEYQNANFINILAFNLRNPKTCDENIVSVLSQNTYILYMSERHIYLTSTLWLADTQQTSIHKIFVLNNKIIPMADGKVDGYINNQFWMDQYNGTLRVATTETGITGIPSNNVFCLDRFLTVVGTLRNIAKNETIQSARYTDTRLYLVTFRRIDPFFVINVANPSSPSILGQLKVTGFSSYLHPYDSNTVIGLGRQATTQGRTQGLKVSLYDVTNVNSPQTLADFVLPQQYAYSTAEWQHKAFLFSKAKNLMVIPGSYYDWQNPANNANSFNGALVFHIKRDLNGGTIQLRGIVNHVLNSMDEFWDRAVERSLYIEELLFTKSRCLLRVHTLAQLNPVVNLNLNCDYPPIVEPKKVSKPVFNPPQPVSVSGTVPVV